MHFCYLRQDATDDERRKAEQRVGTSSGQKFEDELDRIIYTREAKIRSLSKKQNDITRREFGIAYSPTDNIIVHFQELLAICKQRLSTREKAKNSAEQEKK